MLFLKKKLLSFRLNDRKRCFGRSKTSFHIDCKCESHSSQMDTVLQFLTFSLCCFGSNLNVLVIFYVQTLEAFVCLFGLFLNVPVNSYGHVVTVSAPNHTFFLGKLD